MKNLNNEYENMSSRAHEVHHDSTQHTGKGPLDDEQHDDHPILEIIKFSVVALIIVIPIRMFIAQPFIVSGASMEDTFHNGEYLIIDQLTYQFEEPQRGDVVVFRYPRDPSKYFIKRLIGIPGDTLTINGDEIIIKNKEFPEGVILDEPYIHSMEQKSFDEEKLGEGEYFVMGDNRDASSDSRMWGILQRERIVGRALLRLFPFTEVAVFPGFYKSDENPTPLPEENPEVSGEETKDAS